MNLIGKPGIPWGPASVSGLLGYLDGLSYNIDPSMGFFKNPSNHNEVYPQNVKFACTFWPQNIIPPSHIQDGEFNIEKYPYQVDPKFANAKGSTAKGGLKEQGTQMASNVMNRAKKKITSKLPGRKGF